MKVSGGNCYPAGAFYRRRQNSSYNVKLMSLRKSGNPRKQDENKMSRLRQAIKEMQEHMVLNGDGRATEHDALDAIINDCGKGADGYCSMAGSEECDFECSFS